MKTNAHQLPTSQAREAKPYRKVAIPVLPVKELVTLLVSAPRRVGDFQWKALGNLASGKGVDEEATPTRVPM